MNQAGKAKPLQESKLATGITRTDNGWWTVDNYWWIVGEMKKNNTRTKTYWFTGTITLCKYITVNVQVLSHPAWSSNSSQRPHWICGERLWKMMWPLHHPWLHFHPFQVVGILIVLLGLYSFYRYFTSQFFYWSTVCSVLKQFKIHKFHFQHFECWRLRLILILNSFPGSG